MQHNDNTAVQNSETTESKDQIVKEFIRLTKELRQPRTESSSPLGQKRLDYKNKIKQLKDQELLTARDAHEIASSYHAIAHDDFLRSHGMVDVSHCLRQCDSWTTYGDKLERAELKKLIANTCEAIQIFASTDQDQPKNSRLKPHLYKIMNGYKTDKISRKSLLPLIDLLVKLYLNIMDEISRTERIEKLSSHKRSFIRDILVQLRNARLISGDDAYKIALAYINVSITKNFEPLFTFKRQSEWKIYAAQEGNIAAIKETNPGNEFFIRQLWEAFLKSADSVNANKSSIMRSTLTLFHNERDQAFKFLQKQLDDCSHSDSIYSSKHMFQLITQFYLDHCQIKDNFTYSLSELIIDILIKMSELDTNIKTLLEEEGRNAFILVKKHQGIPSTNAELKDLLLKSSSTSLKNILTSLHMTQLEMNRCADLGAHYDMGNNL